MGDGKREGRRNEVIEYKKYFIVGTNDNALHDTMNGNVTGELIRCKDCLYNLQIGTDMRCRHRQGLKGKICADDYCRRAEKEDEYYEVD